MALYSLCNMHTFHIPVMGTGFSIDTPIKVAPFGISSVISLVDDALIEEMRQFYSHLMGEECTAISKYEEDFRARRITAYLNLVHRIVEKRFQEVKNSSFEEGTEITKYFELLPDDSQVKILYRTMLKEMDPKIKEQTQTQLRGRMQCGDINVNIMTKLDRMNYDPKGILLPAEYSDALSALRGFAKSTLNSSIVFSAGFNRRLYSYIEQFEDFFADANGFIKKKIVLKVSDYRSSIIQGTFLAKKGLWVSEYRIESGLNCGGHAFASDGYLMGPILEEFKVKRQELMNDLHKICNDALQIKRKPTFNEPHPVRITAQGGIGTPQENNFLLNYYQLDSTGWATPFLLVPEVTNVDPETLERLSQAEEKDVYLSEVSPLGVPFYTLRNSNSELEKERKIALGRPGSACPKSFLVSNTEFTKEPICTASRQYQKLKIDQLNTQNLDISNYQQQYQNTVKKSCICNDLAEAPLINHQIYKNGLKRFTAVCPGPNIAYFSKIATLAEMVGHIYGRLNLLNATPRPHMFIKELKIYIDYFIKEVKRIAPHPSEKQIQYFNQFKDNLFSGMEYYRGLFPKMLQETRDSRERAMAELHSFKNKLEEFIANHSHLFRQALLVSA